MIFTTRFFRRTILNNGIAFKFMLAVAGALTIMVFWQIRTNQAQAASSYSAQPDAFPTLQGSSAISQLKQQGLDGAFKQAWRAARAKSEGIEAPAELNTNFNPFSTITANDGADRDLFGFSIAMSGDTVVVGAPGDDINFLGTLHIDQGSAYVFVRTGASFVFQQKLTKLTGTDFDNFAGSVAISGNTLVAGAHFENTQQGAAYVFVRAFGTWSLQQRLTANDGLNYDAFGAAAAIDGNTIVVGASYADIGSNQSQGAAYVFTRSGNIWTQQQKLLASDGVAFNHFGISVALQSDTMVIGLSYEGFGPGAAYVFVRSGANWSQQQKLTANDGVNGNGLGLAVALDGNTALIGAPEVKIGNQDNRGAVYVFVRSGATWSQQQKFTAIDGNTDDYFGLSVGLSGSTAVIGSHFSGTTQSAAYVFTRSGGLWGQKQKLVFGNSTILDMGGVAIENEVLLAGAYRANGNGAVYAYEAPNTTPTITPFLNVSRQAGSDFASLLIATVNDVEDAEPDLQVTVNGGSNATVNDVSLSVTDINGNGGVSANIATTCNATTAQFNLRVTDINGAFAETTLTVAVTPNTPPVLTYAPQYLVNPGGLLTILPTTGLSDNGNIASLLIQNVFPDLTGAISINNQGIITITNAGSVGDHTVTVVATDNCNVTTTAFFNVSVTNNVGGAGNLQFYPLAHPIRLLDTRAGQTGCDAPGAMIAGGTSRTQTAAGRTCDGLTIPPNAAALTGNITTVQSGGGYLTLYPSNAARPWAANSNYAANQVLNNVFTVGLGANDGAFKIFVTSNTNLVVDITGYYAPPSAGGLYFHPLPKPIRLLETRQGQSGCYASGTMLQANSILVQLGRTTCDGVTIPPGAQALVGNATTVGPQTGGYLTIFPANVAQQPLAASSNFQTGQTRNAPFTVGLSSGGWFKIFTTSTTDLVIDVLGYYSPQLNDENGQGLLFNSLAAPVRLLDTRAGQSACFTPGAQMTAGSAYEQQVTGACMNIPAAALAVVGNATTVNATANGYLTFWPGDAQQPLVATSNYQMGQVFNRHFTVGLGPDGAFKRYAASTTDLVIDISGYFAP